MRRAFLLFGLLAFLIAVPVHAQSIARVLPDVNFSGVAFSDAIDYIRDVTGANIHVDWKSLEAAGVDKGTVLNMRLRNVQVRKVLNLILNEAGGQGGSLLTFYVDQGVIEITTREVADKQMITRVYPVQDLLVEVPDFAGPDFNISSASQVGGRGGGGGGGNIISENNQDSEKQMTRTERAQALIDVITSTIQPDIWQVNGGTAAIRFFNGNLIVTAPRSVHEALGD
jgi:hypothetical protein